MFEPWVKEFASRSRIRVGCNHSFADLYVNIFDKLQSNLRFQRVKSHLENDDYIEAKALLDKIEKRSTEHNKTVSDFMGSVKGFIITNVFTKDISSGEVFTFTEFKDPNQNHGYAMSNIRDHYYNEAIGNHANLIIDQESGRTKYNLHRQDNVNPIAISTSLHGLGIIKERVEGEKLKTEVIDKLRDFLEEGRKICDLYNDEFLPEIRNIITEIEDEGELKGGCGLSYCPKK